MREYFIDGIRYISKEQFCKLAHVRKANVLKLIQSGLIPYIDIGNQTHRYLIRQSDAEAYLTDRAHDPAKYSFQRKSRIQTYPDKFDRNFANELSQYASVLWKDEPQMLTVQQVHDSQMVYDLRTCSCTLGNPNLYSQERFAEIYWKQVVSFHQRKKCYTRGFNKEC